MILLETFHRLLKETHAMTEGVAARLDELALKFQHLADTYASVHDDAGETRNRMEARDLKEEVEGLRQDTHETGCP